MLKLLAYLYKGIMEKSLHAIVFEGLTSKANFWNTVLSWRHLDYEKKYNLDVFYRCEDGMSGMIEAVGCRERRQPIEKTTFAHDYLSTSQLKRLLDWATGNLHLQDNNGEVMITPKPHSYLFLAILYNNEIFNCWINYGMGLNII